MRRPSTFGGDLVIELLARSVAYIDGAADHWDRAVEGLRSRGAFSSIGVRGAFHGMFPDYYDDGASGSVYGELAWRLGWLAVDRLMTPGEYARLQDEAARWCAVDCGYEETIAEFGPPSAIFGSQSRNNPRTILYAVDDPTRESVSLHFTNPFGVEVGSPGAPLILLGIRRSDARFNEAFTLTPTGSAYLDE
ncbi:hypothetical protein Cs7R123_44850 [Catellatospora sp. TT07R-123]|nr:hypothetical protein Cs7R123_44850 [Catellatospora sp. TT07R-123]